MTALLLFVFIGLSAFAVDVGHWYLVGQQAQRAADAAAMAGVTSLPGDQTGAFTRARQYAKINGFNDGSLGATVAPSIGIQPSQLKVNVSSTVTNFFGGFLGLPTTTIGRSAVADFAGPVPMGSPCNEFGNDPIPGANRGTNCNGTGAFWANVGSIGATKQSGDAYQDADCSYAPDNCSPTNTDYDLNGYFYTVTLTKDVTGLTLQAFDPAWVAVGDNCDQNGLNGAANTMYEKGSSSPYCTGDTEIGTSPALMATQFAVRKEVSTTNSWDPLSYPEIGGNCTKVFQGHNANDLGTPPNLTQPSWSTLKVIDVFRKWVTLCTIGPATKGTYLIQVKSNGLGNDVNGKPTDTASAHNRFGLRAFGALPSDNDSIAVAAYNKMAIYANLPDAITRFHLVRIPPSAAGQILKIRLFDVGDSKDSSGNPINGTITIVPPADSNVGANFTNCTGTLGGATTTLANCSIIASSTTHQGKWQSISVPIPSTYTCTLAARTGCWVKLSYAYGAGAHPNDTTSWTASIEGDPVRLVE